MRIHRYFLCASLGVFLVTALAAAQTPAAKPQPSSANQQAIEALAGRLIAAPDEDARNALLSENKDLVTVDLTRALATKGDQLRRKRGSFAEEHHVYDIALAVAERQNDPRQIGICLSNISLAFKDESDYEQALVYAHKSIATLEPLKDPYLAQVYNNMGVVLKLQGNFTEAVDYYDRALKLSEAQGNKQRIAQASFNLGNVYGDMGNFRLALVEFKRSMELSEALGDQMRLGFNTNSIGSVYETQGDYDLALSYYQQSLKIKEKAANQNEIANVLGNIGWLYHEMGKDAQAQEYLEKALKLKEAAGDKNGAAEALHDEGSVLAEQGNYSEALQRYHASLDVSKALGNKFLVEQTLTEISQAYRAQKDFPHALESAQQALQLARQIGSGGVLYPALDATAMALAGSGKAEQGRALLAQSISAIED